MDVDNILMGDYDRLQYSVLLILGNVRGLKMCDICVALVILRSIG